MTRSQRHDEGLSKGRENKRERERWMEREKDWEHYKKREHTTFTTSTPIKR